MFLMRIVQRSRHNNASTTIKAQKPMSFVTINSYFRARTIRNEALADTLVLENGIQVFVLVVPEMFKISHLAQL